MLHDYRKEIASTVQTKRSISMRSGCTTSSGSLLVSTESDKTCTSSFVFTPATRGRRFSHVYTKPGTTGARDSFPSPRSSSDGADETTAHRARDHRWIFPLRSCWTDAIFVARRCLPASSLPTLRRPKRTVRIVPRETCCEADWSVPPFPFRRSESHRRFPPNAITWSISWPVGDSHRFQLLVAHVEGTLRRSHETKRNETKA